MHSRFRTVQRSYEQPIIAIVVPLIAVALVVAFTLTSNLSQTWPWMVITVGITLWLLVIPLTIEVTSEDVRVRLAGIGRAISLTEITAVEAREYSPLKQFGGWGWRVGRDGARAFTIAGNHAAVLTLTDGREVYLGSRDAQHVVDEILLRLGPQPH